MARDPKPVDEGFDEPSLRANEHVKPVVWHSDLELVVPGRVWTVRGAIEVSGMNFPATATVVREAEKLVMVNALRFDDAMNARILALLPDGGSFHVVRLGAYHGSADSYWRQVHGCKLWAMEEHKLQAGLEVDEILSPDNLPLSDASFFVFDIPRPESALIVRGEGTGRGVAVFCDTVLNFSSREHCGWLFVPALHMLDFFSAVHRPDPLFMKWMCGPKGMTTKEKVAGEYERLLREEVFDSYCPGHGPAVVGGGHEKIGTAVRKMFEDLEKEKSFAFVGVVAGVAFLLAARAMLRRMK